MHSWYWLLGDRVSTLWAAIHKLLFTPLPFSHSFYPFSVSLRFPSSVYYPITVFFTCREAKRGTEPNKREMKLDRKITYEVRTQVFSFMMLHEGKMKKRKGSQFYWLFLPFTPSSDVLRKMVLWNNKTQFFNTSHHFPPPLVLFSVRYLSSSDWTLMPGHLHSPVYILFV